jgi:DNA-directed RNA polymerase specialized sigma24 family protein
VTDPMLTSGLPMATATVAPTTVPASQKGIDLAVLKRGAKDFLDFLDATKEIFYAYLYHRTGSEAAAKSLLGDIYLDILSRALSFWWFGTLNLKLLLEQAEKSIQGVSLGEADLDRVYVQNLAWLSPEEKQSVSGLHDALWTLPHQAQQLLILSLLVGLSDDVIAAHLALTPADVTAGRATAQELLLSRWQPPPVVAEKLGSLVFLPSLDLKGETDLRYSVVEKYNALRMRRYQWVILGGLFAVMSNVIVASVLAFAVITQPPTSLRSQRLQVASLDAVLTQRQLDRTKAHEAIRAIFAESQKIAAYGAARDLTALGLASALESLSAQQSQEEEVNKILKMLQSAKTAFAPALRTINVALSSLREGITRWVL